MHLNFGRRAIKGAIDNGVICIMESNLRRALLVMAAAIIFFSMCAVAALYFFIFLKLALVLALCWILFVDKRALASVTYKFPQYGLLLIPCLYGIALGVLKNNPGAVQELKLYGYAVLSYFILFAVLSRQHNVLYAFEAAAKVSSLTVAFAFYFLFFVQDGYLRNYMADMSSFVIQHPDGYIKVHSKQTTSLLFLLPVMLILYCYEKSFLNGFILAALSLMLFLSGRLSAIILSIAMLPVISVVFYLKSRDFLGFLRALSPIFVPLFFYFVIVIIEDVGFFDYVKNAFSFSSVAAGSESNPPSFSSVAVVLEKNKCSFEYMLKLGVEPGKIGAAIRETQADILYEKIKTAPFFGHGFGYVIDSCIRSETQPWRFELSYLALTVNVGLIGFLLFVGNYFFWLISAFKIERNKHVAHSLIAGSVFFVLCTFTNPYLLSVENIWIFFVPYLIALIADDERLSGKGLV